MHETKLYGFRLEKHVPSEELGGTLHYLTHIQTGAQLVWLENGLENKVFSIALKTLPRDDTGVFHILEHSVLCGSEHFPVKEPFLELLKGSMQTYLNAFTFPDKTIYPVSSRNEQDFLNLVRVYLDAVFFPAIYRQKHIFYQEGWHYELTDPSQDPVYKGVVFNEMKGACGSVDAMMDNELCRLLYPDTCYGYISGGDPKSIPQLTYERFLQAHRDFYHPSNARIYLDGNVPLERVLALLDEDFLCHFQKRDTLPEIPYQQMVPAAFKAIPYEIGQEEDPEGKTHVCIGKLLGNWSDRKKLLAFDILAAYLTGSNAAPLKQAVLKSGLAQDVYLYVNDGMAQPYYALCIRNCDPENIDALRTICRKAIEKLINAGLDPQTLAANIDQLEFMLLEAEEPKGIQRAINALGTWLYGGDPADALQYRDILQQLRSDIDSCYYKTLLAEMFLDEEHLVQVSLLPSKSVGEAQRAAEKAALSAAKASWSEETLQKLYAENQALRQWQATEDTPQAIASLPKLTLADINPLPEETQTQIHHRDGATMLFHPLQTQRLLHLHLYFNLADMPLERFSDLSLLCDLYGDLPTAHYTPAQIQQNIKRYIGSLHISPICYTVPGATELCKPFLAVSVSLLKENLQNGLELVADILRNTCFDDTEKIRQIILQNCEDLNESIQDRGDQFAGLRCLKNHSAAVAVREMVDGYSLLEYLADFDEDFEGTVSDFTAFARWISENIYTAQRLTLSQTAPEESQAADILLPLLGTGPAAPEVMRIPLPDQNLKEAIIIPSSISFTACGENILRFDEQYSGKLQVLSGLLSYSYLWNEIRVKGGAYGCAFGAGESGNLTYSSYQDPSPLNSLCVYDGTADFIRSFCRGPENLEKYIISTLSTCDPLQSPRKRGAMADGSYFTGISYADRCRRYQEILSMKKEDLLSLVPLFEKLQKRHSVCLVCHEDIVQQLDSSWDIQRL